MNNLGEKPSLAAIRRLWRQEQRQAPQLTEAWLKKALPRITMTEPPQPHLRYEFVLGLGASIAVSLLIFLSGSLLSERRWLQQTDLATLLGRDNAVYLLFGGYR